MFTLYLKKKNTWSSKRISLQSPSQISLLNPRSNLFIVIIYLHLSIVADRGLNANNPAHSCKEIRDQGILKKDGKYWIDPEKNGKPLKVYCDMTTDGGIVIKYIFYLKNIRAPVICFI